MYTLFGFLKNIIEQYNTRICKEKKSNCILCLNITPLRHSFDIRKIKNSRQYNISSQKVHGIILTVNIG